MTVDMLLQSIEQYGYLSSSASYVKDENMRNSEKNEENINLVREGLQI